MIEVTDTKSFVATKNISAYDSNGNEIQIVTLYGAVELDRSTSYSFTIINKELYQANKEAIQAEVDAFVAEMKAKITDMGGLQF